MTNEEAFLKDLGDYLDIEFSEFDKGRILGYLKNYKDGLEPITIYKEKEVEKLVYVEANKPIKPITQSDLEREALFICNEYEVPYDLFVKSKNGRTTNEIAEVRKVFCNHIMSNYKCSQEKLRAFFSLNHASINYYLLGKKVRRLKKTA